MNDPLVSIVVPIYNQEKYLDKSIPSLLGQDYTNLELVLVNDGSTDSSRSIVSKYESMDKRIRTVDKPNGGLVDATIAGVEAATGDYIAFLDPDDYVGSDFIANFIKELDADYDFVAKGFYRDNGYFNPFSLKETAVYDETALRKLRNTYVYDKTSGAWSSQIFHARWNKLYKAELLKQVVVEFSDYKGLTLGEDTVFTYLMLCHAKNGKAVRGVNSYYYNIGNQDSMMKNKDIRKHIDRAQKAFDAVSELMGRNQDDPEIAYILFLYLIESLVDTVKTDRKQYKELLRWSYKNRCYQTALQLVVRYTSSKRHRLNLYARRYVRPSVLYILLSGPFISALKRLRFVLKSGKSFIKNCRTKGLRRSMYLYRFTWMSELALTDRSKKMPLLEERITDIIDHYSNDGKPTSVEKNIFIFWWDGFESAPLLVQNCIKSVKNAYPTYRIIPISRHNYEEYTDIDLQIRRAIADGKISIQVFSDILRFNLLKNNGGLWIDATIFFLQPIDLLAKLNEGQSFNSLVFDGSSNFFTYKGLSCSWSGFFIASRKNGNFVKLMDHIFREYYLRYHTFSTYFFIDVAFMICKYKGVDHGVLDKTLVQHGDMFLLFRSMKDEYDPSYLPELSSVPQKLDWRLNGADFSPTSFYHAFIKKL